MAGDDAAQAVYDGRAWEAFCEALRRSGRAVIEHWRLNARVALDLSEAQWIGIAILVLGAVLITRGRAVRVPA